MEKREESNDFLDAGFKAFSCSTRRKILLLTKAKPLTIKELTHCIGFEAITIKRHVKLLISCGLLNNSRKGNVIYYELNRDNIQAIFNTLDAYIKEEKL